MNFLDDNEHELRFTAIGGAPNGFLIQKGNRSNNSFFFFKK